MMTPTHLAINVLTLGRRKTRNIKWAVGLGALLPDVPIYVFSVVTYMILGLSHTEIWDELYFTPSLQIIFSISHSIPFMIGGWLIAQMARSRFAQMMCISMLLHVALDFPVHSQDAYAHFFPFSMYRFESPVSYWDPAQYGDIISAIELLFLTAVVILGGYGGIKKLIMRFTNSGANEHTPKDS